MTIRTMFDGKKIVLPKELEGHDPCVVEIVFTDDSGKQRAGQPSVWDVVARSRGSRSADSILRETSEERDCWGSQ